MPNYHINQKTGNANICKAKDGNCPLKDADGNKVPHFDNKEQAQAFVEQDLAQKHDSTKTLEKEKNKNIEQNLNYDVLEKYYIDPNDVDYEYDYIYGEDGSETIDDDSVYLNSVNVEEIAKKIAGKKGNWQEVQKILENNGASDPQSYSIEIYELGNSTDVIINFNNKEKAIDDLKKHFNDKKQKPQDIKVSTYSPNFDVFNDLSHTVDYDYGYNEDYYSDTIDEDSIVINSIDEEELTKSIMNLDNVSNEEKKQNFNELREILRTAGAFEPENYFGYTRGYDDNSKIYIKPKNDQLQKRIEQEYYKKPNAKDDKGILEYVRSKGQETEGLSPVEAIKKQLTNENNGRRSSLVDNATGASKATLKIRDIKIGAKEHYENVKPLPMESNNTADKIAGVVVRTGTTYRLVDGYHRTKNLMNNKRILSQYIVLY